MKLSTQERIREVNWFYHYQSAIISSSLELFNLSIIQVPFVAHYSTRRGEKRQERQKSKLLLVSSSWAQNIWWFTIVIRRNLIRGQHGDIAVNLSVWCPAAVRGDAMSRTEGGGRSLWRRREIPWRRGWDPREGGGRFLWRRRLHRHARGGQKETGISWLEKLAPRKLTSEMF